MSEEKCVYKDATAPVDARISDLLSRMSLTEKIRQMDMVNGSLLADDMDPLTAKGTRESHVNLGKLAGVIGDKGVGCIHDLYPVDATISNEIQNYCLNNTRLGIPALISEEALHGLSSPGNTVFPQMISVAATFNTGLAERVGRGIAAEMRSKGIHLSFSPVLEIARDPRWGRVEETFGEDTYLAGEMGLAIIRGMQGESLRSDTSVAAEPKHFAGHSIPSGGLNCAPVTLGEHELRRDYLPVFRKAIIEGKAMSVMCAYHAMDGVPCASNKWLLTDLLRGEWGFEGFVCSDLGAIQRLHTVHKTALSPKEALRLAVEAGVDMQFYDYDSTGYELMMTELVESGALSMDAVDRAAASVLRLKFMLGLFDAPYVGTERAAQLTRCDEHRKTALETARECICMLKNNGILPLSAEKYRKIALIGPNAIDTKLGDYSAEPTGRAIMTVEDALRRRMQGVAEVTTVKGVEVVDGEVEPIPYGNLFTPGLDEKGLLGEYFDGDDLGSPPKSTRIDKLIDFNFIMKTPCEEVNPNEFSVRWTGYLVVRRNRDCEIGVATQDEARLWIDGELLADTVSPVKMPGTRLQLVAGKKYSVRLEYTKRGGGGERIRLGWVARTNEIDLAARVAAESDLAVLVLGESNDVCGESKDRSDIGLPGRQRELFEAVNLTGTPIVLVLMNGRPMTIGYESELSKAVLECWYPGEYGAEAIVETLLGDNNPSGRLPMSFPAHVGQLPVYYNRGSAGRDYVDGSSDALYGFACGLSYTTFEYSGLAIDSSAFGRDGGVKVAITVRNAGSVAGYEVVQLYVGDEYSSTIKPTKELKRFLKIYLEAGETRQVDFTLDNEALATLGHDMVWRVEPGRFFVWIGRSRDDGASGWFEL